VTPQRWAQIREIFQAALERPVSARGTFLEEACKSDEALRREVENLLSNQDFPSLESPAEELLKHATAQLAPGQTLAQYRIESKIGQGGMGAVYRAYDTRLRREVALKVLLPERLGDPESKQRLMREARAASALNHPNIVTVYEIGAEGGLDFIAMELVEGTSLKQVIPANGLPLGKVLDWAAAIADALATANSSGIVHRDLKPGNIMLTSAGRVKLLDFGLARRVRLGESQTTLSVEGEIAGTPAYMSPEHVRGEEADVRTDLFSLGAVLYEMATGKRAFSGPTTAAVLHAILAEQPVPPTQLNPDIPPKLEEIINKALEKDPALRYQTAADLRADLKRLKWDSSTNRLPVAGTQAAAVSTPRRSRWQVPAAVALAVAAGTLAWLQLRLPVSPRVKAYQQITNDGENKWIIGSDGVRLYLAENCCEVLLGLGAVWFSQMSVKGGEPVRLPTPNTRLRIWDVSPDGANLLAGEATPDLRAPIWSIPVLGGSPYRVGSLTGHSGAWSPDGAHLAYTQVGNLFVAQSDGSGARKVATIPGRLFSPAWSPDASRIRVSSIDDPHHTSQLWEVPVEGGSAHVLFPDEPAANDCCGRWTPDGRYFLFSRHGQIWVLQQTRGLLRRAPPQPVQLTSGAIRFQSGALLPKDGKQLLAVGDLTRGQVVRYDPGQHEFVPLLPGLSAEYLAFSNDGQWIAYVTLPDGILWRSRADGTARLQLTPRSDNVYALIPGWSPDGARLVFMMETPGRPWKSYVISANGGRPEELPVNSGEVVEDPTWAPRSNRICFGGASLPGVLHSSPNIHILDLESWQVTDLPGSEEFYSPRWSPNERYVVALSSDFTRVMLFDFATRKWREVARGALVSWPVWSHDGSAIFYLQRNVDPAVMRVPMAGGSPERVVDLKNIRLTGHFGASLSLTPNDQPILTRNAGTHEVYALDWQAP
jgi:serine/threonine protein kinase/Tol biopolymer transport system component